jgi:hypothetical protein
MSTKWNRRKDRDKENRDRYKENSDKDKEDRDKEDIDKEKIEKTETFKNYLNLYFALSHRCYITLHAYNF